MTRRSPEAVLGSSIAHFSKVRAAATTGPRPHRAQRPLALIPSEPTTVATPSNSASPDLYLPQHLVVLGLPHPDQHPLALSFAGSRQPHTLNSIRSTWAANLEHCLARVFDQLVDVSLDVADKLPQARPTTIFWSINSSGSPSTLSLSDQYSWAVFTCFQVLIAPHPDRALRAELWRPQATNFMCTNSQKAIAFNDSSASCRPDCWNFNSSPTPSHNL